MPPLHAAAKSQAHRLILGKNTISSPFLFFLITFMYAILIGIAASAIEFKESTKPARTEPTQQGLVPIKQEAPRDIPGCVRCKINTYNL